MELPILDITSLTLRRATTNGLNSTMKESDNMTQETLNLIVSEDKIGEDNPKAHISLFLKKSKKHQLFSNLIPKNKRKLHCRY